LAERWQYPSLWERAFSWFLIVLAVFGYLLFGWSVALLRVIPTAPPACAQDMAQPPLTPQEELFVGVTSSVGHNGFYRSLPIVADANTAICVVRASDGSIVRHYALGGNTSIPFLTEANGVLYYLLQPANQGSQVCAMRASNGVRLWCQFVPVNYGSPSQQPPLVLSDQTLYLIAHGQNGFEVFAFQASDGAILWQQETGAAMFAVANQTIYVPTADQQICALQATTGNQDWCTPAVEAEVAALAADEAGVYVLGQDGEVGAYRTADGSLLWQQALNHAPTATDISTVPLFLEGGNLYITTYATGNPSQKMLTAVRPSDGSLLWETQPGLMQAAMAAGGTVYLGEQQTLQAYQATSGSLLWQQPITPVSRYSLVSGGDVIYLLDVTGNLATFRASDGRLLWEHTQCPTSTSTATQSPGGARIWCTWGTATPDYGSTWWTRTSVNASFNAPGALAPGR
jgi:outer membrane protein assembly factor BamB